MADQPAPKKTKSKPKPKELIGKRVLVGVCYVDRTNKVLARRQIYGTVCRADATEGIVVRVEGSEREYKLPPDFAAFKPAPEGVYRLRSSGETVAHPDFVSTWTLRLAGPAKRPRDQGGPRPVQPVQGR